MTPTLTIRLTKRDAVGHGLALVRPDGSVTGAHLNLPVEHDLIHFAVETELRLANGFYGLVAQGFDLETFETRAGRADIERPTEVIWTEFFVALLQVEFNDGTPLPNFAQRLRETSHLSPPAGVELDEEKLRAIRNRARELFARWQATRPGETLELLFPIPAATPAPNSQSVRRKSKAR